MKPWKWLALIIIVALLASYYVLGTGLMKENRRNYNFMTEIDNLTAVLMMIPGTTSDLEQRLTVARTDLAVAESAFNGETDDTMIVNSVLRLAEETGVTAIPLSTNPWAVEQINGRDYSVFGMTISVTGDFQQLQNFIGGLENSEIGTLAVKYLKVVRAAADPGAVITADLDIAVYTIGQTIPAAAVE